MKNHLKGLISAVLDIKELINRFCGKAKPLKSFSNKSKTFLTANDMLQINSSVKSSVKNINKLAKSIIKQYINNPDELLKFIESKNTLVIRARHAEKLLALVGETSGFITPLNGVKALYILIGINLLSKTKMKLAFSTPAMFILNEKPVNIYHIAHQFHHWLAFKKNMPGYDEETMNNFKNIWTQKLSCNNFDKLSVQEILALKDAVARDIEAIKFVKELTKEYITSKTSVDKLKNGESQRI